MKFVLDENLAEALGEHLQSVGHDAVHVRTAGLQSASDAVVLDFAASEGAVLISADTDFGALLAASHRSEPSLILLRHDHGRDVASVSALILGNLEQVADELASGAVVVIDDERVRVRRLPI